MTMAEMTLGFPELLAFMVVMLVFALAITIPFLVYLHRKAVHDTMQAEISQRSQRELSESCHNFQRELNRQTLVAFNDVTAAMNANTKALTDFLRRESGSVRT